MSNTITRDQFSAIITSLDTSGKIQKGDLKAACKMLRNIEAASNTQENRSFKKNDQVLENCRVIKSVLNGIGSRSMENFAEKMSNTLKTQGSNIPAYKEKKLAYINKQLMSIGLENDKIALNQKINTLKTDISKLQQNIKLEQLKIPELTIKLNVTEELIEETNSTLLRAEANLSLPEHVIDEKNDNLMKGYKENHNKQYNQIEAKIEKIDNQISEETRSLNAPFDFLNEAKVTEDVRSEVEADLRKAAAGKTYKMKRSYDGTSYPISYLGHITSDKYAQSKFGSAQKWVPHEKYQDEGAYIKVPNRTGKQWIQTVKGYVDTSRTIRKLEKEKSELIKTRDIELPADLKQLTEFSFKELVYTTRDEAKDKLINLNNLKKEFASKIDGYNSTIATYETDIASARAELEKLDSTQTRL